MWIKVCASFFRDFFFLLLCFTQSLSLIFANDFSHCIQCRVSGTRKMERRKNGKNTFPHLNFFLIEIVTDFEIGFVQFAIISLSLSFSVGSYFIVFIHFFSRSLLSTYLDFGLISIHHRSREKRLLCTWCMEHKFNDMERKI